MGKRVPIELIPFTNEIGQVINPGDEVIIITSGYGLHISTGKYVGARRRPGLFTGGEEIAAQVERIQTLKILRHKDTNEVWDGSTVPGLSRPRMPYEYNYSTNKRNFFDRTSLTPDERARYEADMDKYETDMANLNAALRAMRAQHVEVVEQVPYRTVLQRNRIFALNTAKK